MPPTTGKTPAAGPPRVFIVIFALLRRDRALRGSVPLAHSASLLNADAIGPQTGK